MPFFIKTSREIVRFQHFDPATRLAPQQADGSRELTHPHPHTEETLVLIRQANLNVLRSQKRDGSEFAHLACDPGHELVTDTTNYYGGGRHP